MKAIGRALLAAAAAFLCVGAAPNWTSVVAKTEAGYRLGNPEAKVKLIAFESYTCSHCAHFEKDAGPVLKLAYVRTGNVSYEVRSFVRDPVDLTAAMLTRCVAPAKFFDAHRAFFLSYDDWFPLAASASKAQRDRWFAADRAAARRSIASDFGFYEIIERQGVSRVQADKCLANDALARKLADQTKAAAETYHVSGTPSFAVDGALLIGTHNWELLRPQIEARL